MLSQVDSEPMLYLDPVEANNVDINNLQYK